MSTLMHVPDEAVSDTLDSIAEALRPGAPLAIGMWGGNLGAVVDSRFDGFTRPLYLRTLDTNRALIDACTSVESSAICDVGSDDWEYQVYVARAR